MTGADRAVEAANKRIVLDMWHHVIERRDFARAVDYIAHDYIQHSPSAKQGLANLIAFLKTELGDEGPLPADACQRTAFEFVLAEGDLVQLMFKRPIPDPAAPGKTVAVWWYDTYRVRNGKIVEHWDCALD